MRSPNTNRGQGFTLIEIVMVIVLIGFIVVALTPFFVQAVSAYRDTQTRAELTSRGRLALERLAREVRQAVPNSIELVTDGLGNVGLQFLSSRVGGRYVDANDNFGRGANRKFRKTQRRFKTDRSRINLYAIDTYLVHQANDVLVIANGSPEELKATGIDTTHVALTGITSTTMDQDRTVRGRILQFANHRFPYDSPGRHFQITNTTLEVGRLGDTLRWNRSAGMASYDNDGDWSSSDAILVGDVSDVSFSYVPISLVSNGILWIELTLAANGSTVRLYQSIQVRDTP